MLDWKSTRKEDADYHHQMMGYLELVGKPGAYIVAYLRDGTVEIKTVTADDLTAWVEELKQVTRDIPTKYTTGDHCTWCPRREDCDARQASLGNAIALVGVSGLPTEPDKLIDAYAKLTELIKAADGYKSLIRDMAIEQGGIQGDGWELAVSETTTEDIIVDKAWPIIVRAIPDAALPAVLKVQKGALKQAIMDGAVRGQKKSVYDGFMEELRAQGAAEPRVTKTVRIKTTKGERDG